MRIKPPPVDADPGSSIDADIDVAVDVDLVIMRLADAQDGVTSRSQLIALGVPTGALQRRLARNQLRPLYRGVYAVGHRNLTPRGHRMAAALAGGPTAVLSHKSAGAAWGLLTTEQTRFDITIPGESRAQRRELRVHRARQLHPEDLAAIDGIPVTSVARTILDLAGVLNASQLLRVIEQAERNGTLNLDALSRVIARNANHKGTSRLRGLLADYSGAPMTRSELERAFLDLVRQAKLPLPGHNVQVAGFTVDAYWPAWRLVVELDSRAYHSDRGAFERDRLRDAKLQRADCRILRITSKRMRREPEEVVADIRALAAVAEARRSDPGSSAASAA